MTSPDVYAFRRLLERAREAGLEDLPIIEIEHGGKRPTATAGLKLEDGTLNPRFKLSPDEAIERMDAGANVGAYGSPDGLLFVDVDLTGGKLAIPPETVETMIEALDTFTVRTRSGGYHLYFQNVGPVGDGTVRNPHIYWHGEDAGECRADWQYVLLPGSFVDPDHDPTGKGKKGKTADATGFYTVHRDAPIRPFDPSKLPAGLTLGRAEKMTRSSPASGSSSGARTFRNLDGLELAIVRQRAAEVDEALGGAVEADRSAADQGLVNRLVWWNFDDVTIAEILRHFRPTEKTAREDYLATTIETARKDIGDERYDPAKLMPKEKAAEIAKAPPPDLAGAINRGALIFVDKPEKAEDLRDLALHLRYNGRAVDEVVKVAARKNATLPKDARLSGPKLIEIVEKAEEDLATGRRRALAAAVKLRCEKTAAPTAEEVAEIEAAREIEEEARKILEAGDPFAYSVETYNLDHVGDTVLGQCCALSAASRVVKNSKGLHIMTTGGSGKGKSDAFASFAKQIPERFKLEGMLSDRVLYYKGEDGSLRAGTILTLDDKSPSESLLEVLKDATTDFRRPIKLHTMTTDRKAISATVPERCILWICKVEAVGDDQIANRMLNLWVDDSEEQDRAVVARLTDEEARDDDEDTSEERREILIARAMWEAIEAEGLIDVNLSRFVRRIRFGSVRNRRNPRMFYDMVKSVARLRLRQRERRTLPNGTVRIYATEDDFRTAEKVFTALHGTAGGQETHLLRIEEDLAELISKAGLQTFDVPTLARLTKLAPQTIARAIRGDKRPNGMKVPGLLDKAPFIAEMDMSESVSRRVHDEESDETRPEYQRKTVTTGRRATVYTFDQAVYTAWKNKTAVWLDDEKPGKGPDLESDKKTISPHSSGISPEVCGETPAPESSSFSDLTTSRERVRERERVSPEKCASTDPAAEENIFSEIASPEPDQDQKKILVPDPVSDPPVMRRNSAKNSERAPIAEQSEDQARSFSETVRRNAEKLGEIGLIPKSQTEPISRDLKIDPADFVELPDKMMIETCPGCGGKVVHYKERYQVVKARGPKAETVRICRSCYNAAKRREVAAVQVLNTVAIDELEKVERPERFGRCDSCNVESVAYHHPGNRYAICAACYAKLAREQTDIR